MDSPRASTPLRTPMATRAIGAGALIRPPMYFIRSTKPIARFRSGSHRFRSLKLSIRAVASSSGGTTELSPVPVPIVHIDQESNPHATVVELSFGDRLGALLDTMKALKELGLNVVKGNVAVAGSIKSTNLSITRSDTGRKVEDPELLESIRLTIISNLLQYHPESSEKLALGEVFGKKPPKKADIKTNITIVEDGPTRSLLTIETADKPGLLLDIVEMIIATSVRVESAEIDTEGLVAKDKFRVSYGGAALSKSLAEVLVNCLRFHLRRAESEDESY